MNAILGISGAVCLSVSLFLYYANVQRDNRPPTLWTRTETRAMATAMLVLILFFAGATLLGKSLL